MILHLCVGLQLYGIAFLPPLLIYLSIYQYGPTESYSI